MTDIEGENNNDQEPVRQVSGGESPEKNLWLFIGVLFFILSIVLCYAVFTIIFRDTSPLFEKIRNLNEYQSTSTAAVEEKTKPRAIDGVLVPEAEANLRPAAVMIDNNFQGRTSGLSRANMVIVAPVEGGVTRFMAFFNGGQTIPEIGPIRSARPYFVDWSRELSALYLHVGGSPAALSKIKAENVYDLNEFYNEKDFWRSTRYLAPHNVYTSSGNIDRALEKIGAGQPKYFSWLFKDDSAGEAPEKDAEISIRRSNPNFSSRWQYQPDNNTYVRYQGGGLQTDLDDNPMRAKNVIIQEVKTAEIDDELRLDMEYIGQGTAAVCVDGVCRSGIWKKSNAVARTRFYDEGGDEFSFNRGVTWIEVVKKNTPIEY